MTIAFDRPVGAPADVKELEYISALYQTQANELRSNASVTAKDIQAYLSSRHGLDVDLDYIQSTILDELAGDLEGDSDDILDLCQITAILLIPKFLQRENDGFMQRVLQFMLQDMASYQANDVSSSSFLSSQQQAPELTRSFLRSLLECYGEFDATDDLLDEMLKQAASNSSSSTTTTTFLTAETLYQALTADVAAHYHSSTYDLRFSTHFEDAGIFRPILQHATSATKSKASRNLMMNLEVQQQQEEEEVADHNNKAPDEDDNENKPFRRIRTLSWIDTIADTYRSQTFAVLLWAALVVGYYMYLADVNVAVGRIDCGNSFGCKVVNGITNWLVIFAQLSILGSAFIVLGGAGNSLKHTKLESILMIVIGIIFMILMGVLPFWFEIKSNYFDTTKDETQLVGYIIGLALSIILIVIQLIQLSSDLLDFKTSSNNKKRCHNHCMDVLLTPGIRKMERRTKKAATYKIDRMVQNALDLHEKPISQSSAAALKSKSQLSHSASLVKYQMQELESERVGGLLWGWKRVWNKTIFTEDGVWLHSRLVASVVAQLLVCVIFIFLFAFLLAYVKELADYIEEETPEGEEPIVYTWEIVLSGSVGILIGLGACFMIAVMYIPSFVSTVLQFRSGVIPSLHSRDFLQYRVALDMTGVLFGSVFWGAVFTALVTTLIVALVLFFCVWHYTRNIALTILAQIVGIICTVALKMAILIVLRATFFAGFYRRRPGPANLMNIVLECWNLGLSAGYMLARTVKLVVAAALYIGRLDTPFLAPGAGYIGPVALDSYPIAFRKDLLVHEAHRHPYIERLGVMYMLKLKYGKAFATRAGSCWRLLFVLAFMPWLRRYRVRFTEDALERELAKIEAGIMEEDVDSNSDEDGSDVDTDKDGRRAALEQRRANLRMMQDVEKLAGNREELLEREVSVLKDEIAALKSEVRRLRTNKKLMADESSHDDESEYDG